MDSEKKESDEKIWNLETKLKKIKDKTDDFCELERKLKSNARELESEKEKGKKMKTQIKALQDANAKYVTSQKELENVNCELSEEHKNLQFFFTNYKEKLQETEGKLRISIEKLSGKDQIDASGQGEKVNSRRNLAHSTNVESLQTSNQTRLFHKISILEEEIATCNNEIEKLSKTALFYKQSCEEKSRILAQIELLTEKNIQDRVNALRNSLIRSLQNHCNSIEENNLSIIDSLKCKNCESNEAIEYISWPCEHSFCSSCITFESTCKICSSTSQLLKLPHFIQIFSKLSQEKLSQNKVKSILSSF